MPESPAVMKLLELYDILFEKKVKGAEKIAAPCLKSQTPPEIRKESEVNYDTIIRARQKG